MIGRDGVLAFEQDKTHGMAYVPWTCDLPDHAIPCAADRALMLEALDALPGSAMLFLAKNRGMKKATPRMRSKKGLSNLIGRAADLCGIAKTAHGLRASRAIDLAQNGATPHQIGAWTGHKNLSQIEGYTAEMDRRRAVQATPRRPESANTSRQSANTLKK